MPKVREQTTDGVHHGCRIWGYYRLADGASMTEPITITPGKSGIWQGILYDATPIIVVPDNAGRYEIVLPPSSALGDYTVNAGRQRLTMRVPDNVASAALTTLLVEE